MFTVDQLTLEHHFNTISLCCNNHKKPFIILAVDRYRCIMQPDKPHFSGGIALLISLLMTAGSILLCVPLYVSAEVRKKYCTMTIGIWL